jgi:glutamyl-tRNA synthetase
MTVVTRFAPSPTGFLHIGGARTALFNYLFSKHHGGQFLLRIEDTDKARSTQEATEAILHGLSWLGLQWDHKVVYQSQNLRRHQEVGLQLYEKGQAYYCDCTPEMLEEMRETALKSGQKPGYNGHCRHRGLTSGALRLKTPGIGSVTIQDLVQGPVTIQNEQIDDMILLRSDGTPTYMLSVVVDDYDMKITHVIRGDDHLTNAFRQYHIYKSMHWPVPEFAHIPMIHGADGSKLSKRHGAIGVEAYEEMGYLPKALRNYLLRLGWGHGDDEIISDEHAIEWFTLQNVGKSPARFDFKKLDNLNAHYLRETENKILVTLVKKEINKFITDPLVDAHLERLEKGMSGLKQRATTIKDLTQNALFYVRSRPLLLSEEAQTQIEQHQDLLKDTVRILSSISSWDHRTLESQIRSFSEEKNLKLGQVAQTLRAALTGSLISPSVFEVMEVLGKEESLGRLQDIPL